DAVYSGGRTACPCSVGHRSIPIAHVAHICERLGLSSVRWDPVSESFPDNADANRLAEVKHHNGWTL
ncbi:MAG: gfo/Idh/MocA family oxidoreductase, partial [Planctomycetes bacterium]|nr:gfo/Idh/MocA family oxidoreductase [Planctomycetota bacterium]